jgi:hypothetical protein
MSINLDTLSYINNVYADPSGNFSVFRDQQPDANGNFEIVQYRVTYIRTCALNLTAVYPIQLIFRSGSDGSTLSGNFFRNVYVDMNNVNTFNVNDTVFNYDVVDGNSSMLTVTNSAGKTLNLINPPAVGAQPQLYNKFHYNGSSLLSVTLGTNVAVNNTNQIFITSTPYVASVNDLTEPNSLVPGFELHLVAGVDNNGNPYPMALSDVTTNLTFHLDSPLKVQSTLFAAMCTFVQHSHALTFNDCRFLPGGDYNANRHLAVTNGPVTFQANTTLDPSVTQINANTIWNFNGGQITVANASDLIMELSDGDYPRIHSFINLIRNLSIRLIGQKSAYTLGSAVNRINYPLNILIDNNSSYELDFKDPLQNPMYMVTYYSDAQVFVTNSFHNPTYPNDMISLLLNSAYAQTAPNPNSFPYTLNYINGSSGHNNKIILLSGNFFNNGGNIVGNNFSNVILLNNPTFTYQNTNGVVNIGNELPSIVGNLGLIQNAGPMSFLVPANSNAAFTLLGNVNLTNCTLNDTTTFNTSGGNLVIDASKINSNGLSCNLGPGNMTVSNSWINVNGGNVPFVLNAPAVATLTLDRNVLDMSANNTIVGNEGTAVNLIQNNTFNVNFSALNLSVCTLNMFNGSNSFNNVFNLNSPTVQLDSNTPLSAVVNLAVNRDVNLSVVGADLHNDSKLVVAGNLVSWNANSSVVAPATPPALTISNTNFSSNSLNTMVGAYVSYLAAQNNSNPCNLNFNNVNFVCNYSTIALACDSGAAAIVAASVNTRVVLDGSGNFLLGNDAFVLNRSQVIVYNGTGTNAARNLYGASVNSVFVSANANARVLSVYSNSLAVLVLDNSNNLRLSDNNTNTNINLLVAACGLQIADEMTVAHNVNLLNGTNINLSAQNALSEAVCISSSANSGATFNMNSGVVLDAGAATLTSLLKLNLLGVNSVNMNGVNSTLLNANAVILIEGLVENAPAANLNKVLTVNNACKFTVNAGGSYNRFIHNKDSMLLTLNAAPSNPPDVVYNQILGGWIQVDFGTAQVMSNYGILSDNAPYTPKSWSLVGSNDGVLWILLDERLNQSIGTWNRVNYSISNNNAYRYMRFIVRAVTGGSIITPTRFWLSGPNGNIYASPINSATFSSDLTPGNPGFNLNEYLPPGPGNNYYMASTYQNGGYNGSSSTNVGVVQVNVTPNAPTIQNIWWSGLIGMWKNISRRNLSLLWRNTNYSFPLIAASTTDPERIDNSRNPGSYLLQPGNYSYNGTITNDSNDWNTVTLKKVSDNSVVVTLIVGHQPWTTANISGSFVLAAATRVYAEYSNNYYAYNSNVNLSLTNNSANDMVVDALGANLTYPLKGTAVKFAEAWNVADPVLANGGEVITNHCNDDQGLLKGLQFASLANLAVPCPWLSGVNSNTLNYLKVYSHEAETAAGFRLNLNKQHTNNTTSHTGKLVRINNGVSGIVDAYNVADTELQGWMHTPIDFDVGTSKIILMPPSNAAVYQVLPIADMNNQGNVGPASWSFNAYTVKNTNSINGVPIVQWLHDYMYRQDSNVAVNEEIPISQASVPIIDPNFNNAQLTANFSKTVQYGFYSINNQNGFYFLNDINMLITWTNSLVRISSVSVPNNNSGSLTFVFNGVDTNNTALSEPVTITLDEDRTAWTVKSFTLSPDVSLYANNTISNPPFPYITNIVNRSDPLQLYVYDISANPSQDFRGVTPLNFFNSTINIAPQFTTDVVVVNNQRQYVATAYVGLIALSNGGAPLTVMNFDNVVGNTLGLYFNDLQSRGSVTVAAYVNNNGNWSANPANSSMNNVNALYRFQITIKTNNCLDQYALDNILMNFTLTAKNNIVTMTPAALNVTSFVLPLYVDIFNGSYVDGTVVKPVWNASTNSQYYQQSINRNNQFNVLVQLSGMADVTLLFRLNSDPANSNNGYNMTSFNTAYTNVHSPELSMNNLNGLLSWNISNLNKHTGTMSLPIPQQLLVGNYSILLYNDGVYNYRTAGIVTPAGTNSLVLNFMENLQQHSVGMTLDRAVDISNNESTTPKSTMNSYVIADSFNNNKLVPAASDWQQQGSPNTLIPANKFTQYYVNLLSNANGISTIGNVAVPNNYVLNGTISFLNEDGNVPGDLEILGNGINAAYTTTTYTNGGVSAQNCFFRRKAADFQPEESYKILRVFVTLNPSDNTNSNFGHLPVGPILIGSIDYTNCSTTSVALSQIFLGNWNLTPSGDGKYILFRNVYDGSDPSSIVNAGSVNNTSYLSFRLPPQ